MRTFRFKLFGFIPLFEIEVLDWEAEEPEAVTWLPEEMRRYADDTEHPIFRGLSYEGS